MNQDIEDILNHYNEVELAFFAKYRMLTYLQETRNQIQHKLDEKNLTKNRIEMICSDIEFNSKLKRDEPHCPRCFSTRHFRKEDLSSRDEGKVIWDHKNDRYDRIIPEIKTCEICGYELNKGFIKNSKLLKFLNSIFKI